MNDTRLLMIEENKSNDGVDDIRKDIEKLKQNVDSLMKAKYGE